MEKFNQSFEKKLEITSKEDLMGVLKKHNINFETWSSTETTGVKTIDDLYTEIQDKDCEFFDCGGLLVRKLRVLALQVFYTDVETGKKYFLVEKKQVFEESGKTRERSKWSSVAEKIKTDEKIDETLIQRALREELQIEEGYTYIPVDVVKNEESNNQSFPGIRSEYPLYRFQVLLSDKNFKPEGYIENQNGLTTYFEWLEIND